RRRPRRGRHPDDLRRQPGRLPHPPEVERTTMQLSDLKNLKIAVVGAGYGGAAAAKALSLLGADVSVYEQATRIREVGAGIGLRPSTMNRFREWGIFDAIAKVSSPSEYFEILTATGDPIMKRSEGRGVGKEGRRGGRRTDVNEDT